MIVGHERTFGKGLFFGANSEQRWRRAIIELMTHNEIVILTWGIGLLFLYGVLHAAGLELIRRAKPRQKKHRHLGLLFTFWGLAILHLLEIAVAATVLAFLLSDPGNGTLTEGSGSSAADYLYFAGVSFATLGYTQLEAHGAIRLLVMTLSLSGFMLLTWSATFIYTIWGESFRD